MDEEGVARNVEVVGSNQWYSLVEDNDGYSLLDAAQGDESVADFPPTDEGAEQAWDEFKSRSRDAARVQRSARLPKVLFGLVVASVGLWFTSGVVSAVVFSSVNSNFPFRNQRSFAWLQVADSVTGSLLLASLALLLAWWVMRSLVEMTRRA